MRKKPKRNEVNMETLETLATIMDAMASFVEQENISPACRETANEKRQGGVCLKNKRQAAKKEKQTVPVFFATDDNYLPFLTVTLSSMKKNASKQYAYRVYILFSGLSGEDAVKLMTLSEEDFSIRFVDVSEKVKDIEKFLHLRDYYTAAIYYRLFIVGMFPQYDKAVYLDCDTIVLGDIAELYNTDLEDNYIGAISDQAVASVPAFCEYTKNALGIEGKDYFNSGVILMNLKKFREENFYDRFYKILSSYDFIVAPDQDCLNLICKGKVKYFGTEWNAMPVSGEQGSVPKLIHYNLVHKPWHYDGIPYEKYFWDYAKDTFFFDRILKAKESFTPEMAKRDSLGAEKLVALAQSEADNENNYIRTHGEETA